MAKPQLKLLLCAPRGFCAGVERAVEIVERSLKKFGAPVYVRHEIVHNKYVLESLRAKGAIFVADLDEVPADAPVIFSAHGVPKSVPAEAQRRNMTFIDATCPLVSKVHLEAEAHHRASRHILMIGHAGHPEVIGTLGQLPPGAITLVEDAAQAETVEASGNLAYITQTTLSVDDAREIIAVLQRRFPGIAAPKKDDICYATTNRQAAVRAVAGRVETMIVIGSKNSSNANRLVEAANNAGCPRAFLADNAEEIDWVSLQHIRTLGIAAGASTPEKLVEETIEAAKKYFDVEIETVSVAEEDIVFKIPRALVA